LPAAPAAPAGVPRRARWSARPAKRVATAAHNGAIPRASANTAAAGAPVSPTQTAGPTRARITRAIASRAGLPVPTMAQSAFLSLTAARGPTRARPALASNMGNLTSRSTGPAGIVVVPNLCSAPCRSCWDFRARGGGRARRAARRARQCARWGRAEDAARLVHFCRHRDGAGAGGRRAAEARAAPRAREPAGVHRSDAAGALCGLLVWRDALYEAYRPQA
jgi:hypothetical protein